MGDVLLFIGFIVLVGAIIKIVGAVKNSDAAKSAKKGWEFGKKWGGD